MVCAQAIDNAQLRNLAFQLCAIIPNLCRAAFLFATGDCDFW